MNRHPLSMFKTRRKELKNSIDVGIVLLCALKLIEKSVYELFWNK